MDDMNMGNMGMASSPVLTSGTAPAPTNSMSGNGTAAPVHMQMFFYAAEDVTLWLKPWQTENSGSYAGSIVGLIVLCVLQEGITALRTYITSRYQQVASCSDADHHETAGLKSPPASAHSSPLYSPWSARLLWRRMLVSALYWVNIFVAYLLMLAVMTYNVGYLFAVVSGLALGNLIFFHTKASLNGPKSGSTSDFCHVQQ
ncbi:hypothetical protein WJX73_002887 [Symbiochloris irregularis]|uniref:Copper transport protein n=1 Tax=Symbiochloris irregularis TaxID=706552 RepID=A0AAW1NVY9_9CHLO